jgi:DNA repair protein RecN (Recombination protein N)
MLFEITIENIAVISKACIRFKKGLNVLTGETGAGKSILLDAIGTVLGQRTSKDIIRTGETKAFVTALFTDVPNPLKEQLCNMGLDIGEEDDLTLSREITSENTICRVNSVPVTVSVLRSIGSMLINIHGQNDHQMLSSTNSHRNFIDAFGDLGFLLEKYQKGYRELRALQKELNALKNDEKDRLGQIDYLEYQINELTAASMQPGEDINLSRRHNMIRNSAFLSQCLASSYQSIAGKDDMPGAVEMLDAASDALMKAQEHYSDLSKQSSRLTDIRYEIEEIAKTIFDSIEALEFDPGELDEIEGRLDLINRLKKKYGSSVEEMLLYIEKSLAKLDGLKNSELNIERLENRIQLLEKEVFENANSLSIKRKSSAAQFTESVLEVLKELDMPNVQMETVFAATNQLTEFGIDEAEFYFSVNPGEQTKPMAKCASGGEMSRIMLAIKSIISGKDDIPTLIFDEIDSGISGRAAEKVGRKLKQAAQQRQIICVTHLAQVACFSDNHFAIEKATADGRTHTTVTPLGYEERILELARIMSGEHISSQAIENAKALLSVST